MQNKLYQCPFKTTVKCDMEDGCAHCEDFDPVKAASNQPCFSCGVVHTEMVNICTECADIIKEQ